MIGLLCSTINNVTIDNKFNLIQWDPENCLEIIPIIDKYSISFEQIAFYANCLSYEHDLIVLVFPKSKSAIVNPIFLNRRDKEEYLNYYSIISQMYIELFDIKYGYAVVPFRYYQSMDGINIDLSSKYKKVAKELSMYSTALRQLDPLSEFLNYYRIIESVANNNGKSWIEAHIKTIYDYDYGFLEIIKCKHTNRRKRYNLFSIYKKRAWKRVEQLKKSLTQDLSEYLYNENRCGIAHGLKPKLYDFDLNVIDIYNDNYIMKLLARIAIEEKLNTLNKGSEL